MAAFEVLSGSWSAGQAAGTAITMATGDSLQIRNAPIDSRPIIAQLWGMSTSDASIRVRSPNMHDNVEGLRVRLEAGVVFPELPWTPVQQLVPQDTLTVTTVDAVPTSEVRDLGMLIYYPTLPGIEGRFLAPDEVKNRAVDLHPTRVTISTTAGINWQGSKAITADQDLLRANTDYAILGYALDNRCASIGIRGVDFGNVRIGGPGDHTRLSGTKDWFLNLSNRLGVPAVPVFNSANKNGIFVDVVRSEAAASVTITFYLARLK
jgi:hypothetical protein